MTIDHRRPLIAFIGVTLLCAFVMVNGYLLVARSPMGGDLANSRGLFSGLEEDQPLLTDLVDGTTVVEETGAEVPGDTTTEAQVPAIDAIRDVARTTVATAAASRAADAGDDAGTPSAGGNATRTDVSGDGRSDPAQRDRPGDGRSAILVAGRQGTDGGSSGGSGQPGPGTPAREPVATDAKPGHGPTSGVTPPGHTTSPAKNAQAPGQSKPAPEPKPATPPKPTKPAKPTKPPKSDPGTKPQGSPGHSSHGTPPGHVKHDKAPKPPKPSHGTSSHGSSQGKSHGKPQGQAKGHGHH